MTTRPNLSGPPTRCTQDTSASNYRATVVGAVPSCRRANKQPDQVDQGPGAPIGGDGRVCR